MIYTFNIVYRYRYRGGEVIKKITLKNTADELGVSKGTVDRAIHNRPGISVELKNKIMSLIEKYGYKPSSYSIT